MTELNVKQIPDVKAALVRLDEMIAMAASCWSRLAIRQSS
jgi:hypothetical protein